MTAAQAKKTYKFKSIKKSGSKIRLKNSDGKKVTVGTGSKVYHRGHGNFGIYSAAADKARKSSGATRRDRIGKGTYRHTDDKRNR